MTPLVGAKRRGSSARAPRRTSSAAALAHALLRALGVGIALGMCELLLVAATQPQLFLSLRELGRFGFIAACVAVSLNLMLWCLFASVGRVLRRLAPVHFSLSVALVSGLAASPHAAWLFWALSEGRRVRTHPWRAAGVWLAALLVSLGLAACVLAVLQLRRSGVGKRAFGFVLALMAAAGCLALDVFVLRRLYPAFHIALDVLALLCTAAASALWPWSATRSWQRLGWASILALAAAFGAPFLLRGSLAAPNLGYAIEQASPLSGKLLPLLAPRSSTTLAASSTARPPFKPTQPSQPALSLRGDSILLITIDALRSDRLQTYGATQVLTPELDRLAEQSVVFTRAYTQTPHTSYALGSLFTGKYLRPVLALPGAPQEQLTLPRLLRRFGYRTAAFYPPAVFFVDEERFGPLAREHFGFEYVKEMFASAADRVVQLEDYLQHADPHLPVFVWVHLFEPHEPYVALPQYARGDELEQRYDAEVAAADAAVGELVRVFRTHKPGATTIVSADHGEEFDDHGGFHHGTTLFDEQVRVPLLWSSPGRTTSRRVAAPVQLIDLAPTLLAALAIPREPRMRGNDLGALLVGGEPDPALRAFASIDELRMWTDGTHKLICEASRGRCRLYDLLNDPRETRDIGPQQPGLEQKLAGELSELVASIPGVEALSMQGGDAWPKALARARLGDASAGPELLPLLADKRPAVRAEALRAVATLKLEAANSQVATLESLDPDPVVRDEAALSGLALGDGGLSDRVQEILEIARHGGLEKLDLARRAAFALLPVVPAPSAAEVLAELAADRSANLAERERALNALAVAEVSVSVPMLVPLLEDVRLRPAAARALGALGGPLAKRALRETLARERYAEARSAEAAALVELGDREARPLLVRMLGTETGLPGGLSYWAALGGQQNGPHGRLLDLRVGREHPPLHGHWECILPAPGAAASKAPPGCTPGPKAALTFARAALPVGDARAQFSVHASQDDDWIQFDARRFALRRGLNDLAFALPASAARHWIVASSTGARLLLVAVVPRADDVPPPPPEPFDASEAAAEQAEHHL